MRSLTHAALAVRAGPEAGVTGALEGAHDVDAAAVGTQAAAQGALVHVWGQAAAKGPAPHCGL